MINDDSSQQAASLIIEEALQHAIAQHQAGQLLEAEQLYRGILQLQPHHAEANHNLGVLEVLGKRPAAGLAYLMAALEADPAHGQYWLSYIDALYQDGQIEAAREALELARQQGLQGNGVTQLALLLAEGELPVELSSADGQDTGSDPLADALFAPKSVGKKLKAGSGWPAKSAKKFAPYPTKNPDTNEFNKLLALFTEGNYAAAASLAQKMTMRFPQHGFGWMLLGASLQQMGRSADALAPMKKALSLTPGDAATHCNMGAIYNDLGRLEEAEACYLQALEISPDYAMAYSNLGNTQHEMGRLFEAEASYRRALEINPEFAEAHSNLGKTLDEVVESTVDAYLAYVAKTGARYGHKIIVAGVPATNIRLDALARDSAAQLVQLIRLFNAAIKQRTLAAGMGFLDIYALTDRGDGIASADWHIDEVHLRPEALAEAFERYCLHY